MSDVPRDVPSGIDCSGHLRARSLSCWVWWVRSDIFVFKYQRLEAPPEKRSSDYMAFFVRQLGGALIASGVEGTESGFMLLSCQIESSVLL
jgi:hypothetical protein